MVSMIKTLRYRFVLLAALGLTTLLASTAAAQVARVSAWTQGLTHTVGAGSDRLLIFEVSYESNQGTVGDPTSVTYGGSTPHSNCIR